MLQKLQFPMGIALNYDDADNSLRLASLFGMAAGFTVQFDDDSRDGLFVVCLDEKRYESDRLKYTVSSQGNVITIIARPTDRSFTITSTWTLFEANGIIHCRTRLKNEGQTRVLRRAYPRWTLVPGKYSVYSQLSRWSAESQGSFQPLRGAALNLKGRSVRSSVISTPYCAIRDDENNTGLACHVIPRGNWSIRVRPEIMSNDATCPVLEAGLSDEDLFMKLKSGCEIELPEVILQHLPEGRVENGAVPLQRYVVDELLPRDTKPLPVVYNGWLYRFTDFTREQMREQLAAAKRIGCEVFIIDAGWFGPGEGWSGQGDWREKSGAPFYGNMAAFADEVRAAGLKFGFWMEPERWNVNIPIRTEHPEWFVDHSQRIDLTQPDAANYFHDIIAYNVKKFGAEYLKMDFNMSMGYDETGAEMFNYYNAWRSVLLQLHKEFPDLYIENCGSGGLKNDLDTCQLYDHAFVSDNAHPYETLRIRQGLMPRTVVQRTLNWLVLRPAPERYTPVSPKKQVFACSAATWDEGAIYPLDYVMLSGFIGIPGFSGDLAALPDDVLDDIRAYIDVFKANRDWLAKAHVRPITNFGSFFDYEDYLTFQISSKDGAHQWLLVYTNPMSRRSDRKFVLKGLDDARTYTLKQLLPQGNSATMTLSGRELMTFGAPVHINSYQHIKFDAALIELS